MGPWIVTLFGPVVPNGFFEHWLMFRFQGAGPVREDRLALGCIVDLPLTLLLLGVYFAKRPIGAPPWPWFSLLSLIGGLGFSLRLYHCPNARRPLPQR